MTVLGSNSIDLTARARIPARSRGHDRVPALRRRRRLGQLGMRPLFCARNPLAFMELQDVWKLSNFSERRVSSCQVWVSGAVSFDDF